MQSQRSPPSLVSAGLGFPGRALAVRAIGTGGAFGLFDPESSQNPAALASVQTLTACSRSPTSRRTVENPAGTASVRDTRFPQLMVAGPVRPLPLVVGISFSNYTTRDFYPGELGDNRPARSSGERERHAAPRAAASATSGLRAPTVSGLNGRSAAVSIFITGSNRLTLTRRFDDPDLLASRQRTELSFAGVGLSVGVTRQFGPSFRRLRHGPVGRTRQHGPRLRQSRHRRSPLFGWTGCPLAHLAEARSRGPGPVPDLVRRQQRSACAGWNGGAEHGRGWQWVRNTSPIRSGHSIARFGSARTTPRCRFRWCPDEQGQEVRPVGGKRRAFRAAAGRSGRRARTRLALRGGLFRERVHSLARGIRCGREGDTHGRPAAAADPPSAIIAPC